MHRRFPPLALFLALLVPLWSLPAGAGTGSWTLDADASSLSVVSIKNNSIAEVHRFPDLSGSIGADGEATLSIGLDSVQTGIGIRDKRMREMLFETGRFASATVTLAVDADMVDGLAAGEQRKLDTEAALDLHGASKRVPATLHVTRLDDARLFVTSEQPVLVDAGSFALVEGIDALRKVAGLQAIGSMVPVSFALTFVADGDGTE